MVGKTSDGKTTPVSNSLQIVTSAADSPGLSVKQPVGKDGATLVVTPPPAASGPWKAYRPVVCRAGTNKCATSTCTTPAACKFTGLPTGVTYIAKVVGVRPDGSTSPWSNEVTFTTAASAAAPPPPPRPTSTPAEAVQSCPTSRRNVVLTLKSGNPAKLPGQLRALRTAMERFLRTPAGGAGTGCNVQIKLLAPAGSGAFQISVTFPAGAKGTAGALLYLRTAQGKSLALTSALSKAACAPVTITGASASCGAPAAAAAKLQATDAAPS